MRIVAALKWLATAALATFAVTSQGQDTPQAPPGNTTYLIIYKRGPAWVGNTLAEQNLKEHGSYLLDLYEKGVLKFAGGFLDDSGGAVVLEAKNQASVKAMVANDPAVKHGTFVAEIRPWNLQPWDVYLQRRRERERNSQ